MKQELKESGLNDVMRKLPTFHVNDFGQVIVTYQSQSLVCKTTSQRLALQSYKVFERYS